MNFLAHTLLSCKDPNLLAGNFMADFISQPELKHLEPNILLGITLHKKIDHYTDHHPQVKQSIDLLRPTQGKYSPVTVDILYDFFLIKNWDKYSAENLSAFTLRIYEMLELKKDDFPLPLREKLPRMIEDDFLMSCQSEERLIRTFTRVHRRAKFSNNFLSAHKDLEIHHEAMDQQFNLFFPDLMLHITNFCDCHS